jgi:hypothetical protein
MDTEKILNNVYWMRQIFSILTGIVFGQVPLLGLYSIIGFFVINLATLFIISKIFSYESKVIVEDTDPLWALLKEGMFPSFTTFLVKYYITFSCVG